MATDIQEYAVRRRKLLKKIGKTSVAIIRAAKPCIRSKDLEYPFRQNSDFKYLTGFNEPDALAVLVPERDAGEFVLFCREADAERDVWEGACVGTSGAVRDYGADQAFPIRQFPKLFPELLEERDKIFFSFENDGAFATELMVLAKKQRSSIRSGGNGFVELASLDDAVHEMRLRKSRREVALMQRAVDISVAAHYSAMRISSPGENESALAAELVREFVRNQACEAYPCIVGAGANSCVLHYFNNCAVMEKNSLVLIDAGAEYAGYAADITRTFPVGGRFSPQQKALYEVVLGAQEAAIKAVKPGNVWNDPHAAAVRELTKGLIALQLISGPLKRALQKQSYRKFYMHKTGHWLGMDVHDVGDYKVAGQWRPFVPGMVLTVEPGLYIPKIRKRGWQRMGVRIEDDVLVTETGNKVLSEKLVRKPEEIEAYMAEFR